MGDNKTIRTFSLVLLSGFGFIVQFLSAPFLARSLTLANNGMYHQTILVIDIFFMLFALGIGNVTYLYLKREDYSKYEVFWSNLLLAFIIGFCASFLIYILAPFLAHHFGAPELSKYLRIYGFILLLKFPLGVTEAAVILFGKVRSFTIRTMVLSLFNTGMLIIIIQLTQNLILLFIVFILLSFIHLIISFLLVPDDFYRNVILKRVLMGKMLLEGFYIALNSMFGRATLLMDKAIVSAMLVPAQYAMYRNGAIEIPFFSSIYRTVSTTVLPELSKLISKGEIDEVVRLKRKAIINTALVVYPVLVFLLFFNERFIILYLSEKYIDTVPVFTIFTLTLLLRINSYGDVILCSGRYKTLIRVTALGFITGVMLNIIFISIFGFIGAAIATLITIALVNYYYLVLSSKILKIPIFAFFDFKFLAKVLITCVIIAFLLSFVPFPKLSILYFLVLGVSYTFISYFIILRYYLKDKSVVIIIIEKLPLMRQIFKRIINVK